MAIPLYYFSVTELILTISKDSSSTERCIVDQSSFQRSGPVKEYIKIIVDGPEEIATNAFYDCSALQEIYIGTSVDTINVEFARFCSKLSKITVNRSSIYFESDDYGSLYNRGCTVLYRSPPNRDTLVLSQLLTKILTQAFGKARYNYLEIPKKVTSIASSVALDATIAELVFVSDSLLEQLGSSVFEINYIGSFKFASKLKSIGAKCFQSSKPVKRITFPADSSLTALGTSAMSLCISLETVELPPLLTKIESNLFQGCTKLKNLYISSGISSIISDAFSGCAVLSNITVDGSNNYFMIDSEGALINKAATQVFVIPPTIESYRIPDNMTEVGRTSLQLCPNLTSLDIGPNHPKYLKNTEMLIDKISNKALAMVGGATSVVVPESVNTIVEYFAYQCQKLVSITLPGKLVYILGYAFQGCSSLLSISIPSTVTKIESYAFDKCQKLTSVTFSPSGTVRFGSYAFNEVTSLEQLIFDCAVESVSYYSFRACGAKRVVFNKGKLKALHTSAFALMNRLQSIQFPSSLENITFGACSHSSVQTVTFKDGNNIKYIEMNAFAGCTQLKSFEFSPSLVQIDVTAFSKCSSLTSVAFDNNCAMTELTSSSIFQSCTSLEKVTFHPNLRSIDSSVFQGYTNLHWFNISSTSSYFKTVNGILYDTKNNLILCPTGYNDAVIDSNTVSFATRCFYGCSALKSIDMRSSESLESISDFTFYQCSNLMEISFPSSVSQISNSAFLECSSLATVTFSPKCRLLQISECTFKSCTRLNTINLEQCTLLTKICASAFANCQALVSIRIPAPVKVIEESAFSGCAQLEKVAFAKDSNLTSLGASCFKGCECLESVEIPKNVTDIGASCFEGCVLGRSLTLPKELSRVGSRAFFGCDVRYVYYCSDSLFDANPFDSDIRAFVHLVYPSDFIFGVPAERALDHGCVLITAVSERSLSVAQEILISTVVLCDNAEGG